MSKQGGKTAKANVFYEGKFRKQNENSKQEVVGPHGLAHHRIKSWKPFRVHTKFDTFVNVT